VQKLGFTEYTLYFISKWWILRFNRVFIMHPPALNTFGFKMQILVYNFKIIIILNIHTYDQSLILIAL